MLQLGPIGFAAPLLLVALIAVPLLIFLLRAVPPAPVKQIFPAVALLLGLKDRDTTKDKTPLWLLLLRMLAITAIILGFAQPILNPRQTVEGSGPLLVFLDGTWADAADWDARLTVAQDRIERAGRAGRPVAVTISTDLPAGGPVFQSADVVARSVSGLAPNPWMVESGEVETWVAEAESGFETYWISDGIEREGRLDVLAAFEARGEVTLYETNRPVAALSAARFVENEIVLDVTRSSATTERSYTVTAIGRDPAGALRDLAAMEVTLAEGETTGTAQFDLPAELRNRITRFEIANERTAAAVALTDDSLKRREIGLIAANDAREGLELLSPLHYLREALTAGADVIEFPLADTLSANPDVLILADVARLSPLEEQAVVQWVNDGGLLIRFAGPRLAAIGLNATTEDPLLPVALRSGGRSVGGTMSWGEPKSLAPFAEGSPFEGLSIPADVTVSQQVVAQPDPNLADRVLAQLTDGTPLVTRRDLGAGQIVLFHVTANAEWSMLPLSGLFVEMLERLTVLTRRAAGDTTDIVGRIWSPEEHLDGFGTLIEAENRAGVDGSDIAAFGASAAIPPGLYAGSDRRLAVNLFPNAPELRAMVWPTRINIETPNISTEVALSGTLLTLALALFVIDTIASLALSGRLRQAAAPLTLIAALLMQPPEAQANDDMALLATADVVLAYVQTGNARIDEVSRAGLMGISDTLTRRTSIEPAAPMGIDIEADELSFFPLIYWPITDDQPVPSGEAYAKLNRYLRSGGMIFFDTQDADLGGFGGQTANGRRLQIIATGLDIPPIEPIPADHVLTRTFYLLQDFPGRYTGGDLWVEATSQTAQSADGMPFRNLNDGVTPVIVGSNDWAAAWAIDERGNALFPVGRGMAGDRQRETARRFGVNVVMHVLTGNYKSDQVHVPALLDRLGE